jgi:hypothetical protein
MLLHRLGEHDKAQALLRGAVERDPANLYATLNYLEFLLLTEDGDYVAFRESLDPLEGPPWYPVVVELFDLYRDNLLPARPDPARLAAWEEAAQAQPDSVHRDFDDLTALLDERNGDVATWRHLVQVLLK